MSGFDNGSAQSGVFFQAKQFGPILRGFGPPVPQAGVVGDVYIDTQTWFIYSKRAGNDVDPWGHYLFVVPVTYRNTLKWFASSAPSNDIGVLGDYCLAWAGWANYGLQPSIFGPRAVNGWTENGDGTDTPIDPLYALTALPAGLSDEGAAIAYSSSTQLIVAGLADEFILAIPAAPNAGDPVTQLGLGSYAANITVVLNPLYTADDRHGI